MCQQKNLNLKLTEDSQNGRTDASFGNGPCSQNSAECIGKGKAQQCFTDQAVKLNNPTVKMDTDKTLLLNYNTNITNEDFLGFVVFNYTQCLRNSEDVGFDGWLFRDDIFYFS